MTNTSGLSPEIKGKIIALCKALIPEASIWLYGSRATGEFGTSSDIDIALEALKPIGFFKLAELKEVLQATDIPYKIDLIDINSISDQIFKQNVIGTRILWKK